MKRPLCLAIALALSLAAGCSTPDSRQSNAPETQDARLDEARALAGAEGKDEQSSLESVVVTGSRIGANGASAGRMAAVIRVSG